MIIRDIERHDDVIVMNHGPVDSIVIHRYRYMDRGRGLTQGTGGIEYILLYISVRI